VLLDVRADPDCRHATTLAAGAGAGDPALRGLTRPGLRAPLGYQARRVQRATGR
jgi:hypothetical protein